MMLKKFAKLYPRGYHFAGAKIRSCQTPSRCTLYSEGAHSKPEERIKDHHSCKSSSPEKDGLADIRCAEDIIFKILHSSRTSPTNKIDRPLKFCGKYYQKYKASIGEQFYLWCSGVVAATSVLVCKRLFIREDYGAKAQLWLNPQTLEQALKGFILGDPRERVLLSVKATEDSATCTLKSKSEIDHAAKEFKAKSEECTASMLNKLGLLLMKSNQHQAVELLMAASEAGHTSAIYNMGLCFEHGRGVPKDIGKAIEYYNIAANKGHGKAQFNLGSFYIHGAPSLQKNEPKAIELLVQAAYNGIAKAQVYLGIHFAKNNDHNNSAKYFSLASDQQDPVGMYHYAVCLENGWGVEKDMVKAGMLYKRAAEMGDVSAMFNTAVYYENGLGGFSKSRRLAMDWYDKAANGGDEEARKKFRELLVKPPESKNIMHPILRDILTWGVFHAKPKQEKDFHRSRSAPNLGEVQSILNVSNPISEWKKSDNIVEDPSESLSSDLSASNDITSLSPFAFRLV